MAWLEPVRNHARLHGVCVDCKQACLMVYKQKLQGMGSYDRNIFTFEAKIVSTMWYSDCCAGDHWEAPVTSSEDLHKAITVIFDNHEHQIACGEY